MKLDGTDLYLTDRINLNYEKEYVYQIRFDLHRKEAEGKLLFIVENIIESEIRYSTAKDTLFVLINQENMNEIYSYSIPDGQIRKIQFRSETEYTSQMDFFLCRDGKKALVIEKDSLFICIIDLENGDILAKIDIASYANYISSHTELFSMEYAWDGEYLVIPDGVRFHIYDGTGQEIDSIVYSDEIGLDNEMPSVCLSPDQKYLYFMRDDKICRYTIGSANDIREVNADNRYCTYASWYFGEDDSRPACLTNNAFFELYSEKDEFGIVSEIDYVKLYDSFEEKLYFTHFDSISQKEEWYCYPKYSYEDILKMAKERTGEGE